MGSFLDAYFIYILMSVRMGGLISSDASNVSGVRRGWFKEVTMTMYMSADSAAFIDEDLERWGSRAESGVPYDGGHLGSSVVGHPVSVGIGAKPFTLHLNRSRRAKLVEVVQEHGTTPSQLVCDLIDLLE